MGNGIGSVGGRRMPTSGLAENGALQMAAWVRAFGLKRSSSSRISHLWAPSAVGSPQLWDCRRRRVVWSAAATVVSAVLPGANRPNP